MSATTAEGQSLYQDSLKSSNSEKPNVTVIRVPRKITLLTPLCDGSSNDGSGEKTQKAMIYGEKYEFAITLMNGDEPANGSQYCWAIEYESPDTSRDQMVRKDLGNLGSRAKIEIDNPDFCGCDLKVKAYLDDPDQSCELVQFVHNRFRWFDAKRVESQVKDRMQEPWRIDQGRSSLCGMAALYYVTIKRSPDRYRRIAHELHRTGLCKIDDFSIEPSSSMYEVKPNSSNYENMSMWEADWIVLAGTRSSESNLGYHGIETGNWDQFTAINWPGMMEGLVKKIAGYENVSAVGISLIGTVVKKALSYKGEDVLSALADLKSIDDIKNKGHQILLMIDARMIKNESGYSVGNLKDSHWVVYEGGLLDGSDQVSFKLYTWGYNPETIRKYNLDGELGRPASKTVMTPSGIDNSAFESNYYGYIEAF
ncbi:hypothetical protein KIF53_21480 [Chromobacterium subtsugae]|uniref:Uncharacterized protein n=1 Tax=Chromobacterium subtsugae TaxID=251747 RepID=A0ABS7FL89_9NEIS|nr:MULTISPECIES: hypothetical protein [Chromobacterium]MBW7569145.1 hypothetical protein [Chromobacterium subtsugae]MBW8290215.1 hypothetical protein [Chromobacterium subtsugae]WSE91218.1 hypothetical protein U6115_20440 [Chromobacterium subtsugae]WVH59593.1 hypothetical protein U6151_20470 [Chromobacterium subtsugae]